MDVTRHTFQSQLPLILEAIARSRFISFDLELSGIPGRQTGQTRASGRGDDGKQTLQQRYEETKAAAERYQIIQLGLTCVEEDVERSVYVTRPYNFFLSPVPDKSLDKTLDVERDFTYQSSAVQFLLSHGFRMDAPFVEGVPYLSRMEEAQARSTAIARLDRYSVADIAIAEDDTENRAFIGRVRKEVEEWVKGWRSQPTRETAYLNIAPTNYGTIGYNGRGLNGYQKRLVHQLIRAEFPDVVSLSMSDFVQLLPYDQRREDAQIRKKLARFDRNVRNSIGLRWVAEALCPDIDRILPDGYKPPFASGDLTAVPMAKKAFQIPVPEAESLKTDQRLEEMLHILKTKRTNLVGHNLFLDLIFFFTCFFGPLPDRVEDFSSLIAQIFPLVFDTKYLADKINDNSPLYRSSLDEIDLELSKLPGPVIETPAEHRKYLASSPAHEAGFDSFLTARVLIKLSARTDATENGDISPKSEDEEYESAQEEGGVFLNGAARSSFDEQKTDPKALQRTARGNEKREGIVVYHDSTLRTSEFSGSNPFALLGDLSLEDRPQPPGPVSKSQNLSLEGVPQLSPHTPKPMAGTMMPPKYSPFWLRYGNKLRVNGTVEEVCPIQPVWNIGKPLGRRGFRD